MKKLLSYFILAAALGGGTPAWAETPGWSLGGYSNFGVGSRGTTLVPGVTAGGPDWAASAHFAPGPDSEVAVSADWLGGPSLFRLPWLRVGPGLYLGVATGDAPVWGAGLRGVARVDKAFGPVVLFGAVVPALGAVWSDQVTVVWNADAEIGIIYLLP